MRFAWGRRLHTCQLVSTFKSYSSVLPFNSLTGSEDPNRNIVSVLGTTSGESAGISKVEELRAATTFGRPEAQLSQAAHDLKVGEEEVAAC